MIFHSSCFISGFPWLRGAVNKKATEPWVPGGKVEVIISTALRLVSVTEYLCHR